MSSGEVAVWGGVGGVGGTDSTVMDRGLSGLQIPELAGDTA